MSQAKVVTKNVNVVSAVFVEQYNYIHETDTTKNWSNPAYAELTDDQGTSYRVSANTLKRFPFEKIQYAETAKITFEERLNGVTSFKVKAADGSETEQFHKGDGNEVNTILVLTSKSQEDIEDDAMIAKVMKAGVTASAIGESAANTALTAVSDMLVKMKALRRS